MVLHVGIDAGGSGTRAVATGADLIPLATHVAGPANATTAGAESVAARLAKAVRAVCARASLPAEAPLLVACGIAGAGEERVRVEVAADLGRCFADSLVFVCTDAEAALAGAGDDPEGGGTVALVAGTGAIAVGRGRDGALIRAGGWGHLVGDEGSTAWIARRALRAALLDVDGRGPETGLRQALFDGTHLAGPDAVRRLTRASRPAAAALAELFPVVLETARTGDRAAQQIFTDAAAELACAASAVARRLAPGPVRFACAGGAFAAGSLLVEPLSRFLLERHPDAKIISLKYSPEIGVLRLALSRKGRRLP